MENMRQRIDLGLQPLGRPSQPRKGVVGEDLGLTQFVSGPSRGVPSSFQKTKGADFSESDDELDAFSSKNKCRSSASQSNTTRVLKTKAPLQKGCRVSKATKSVEVDEESNSKLPVSRPKPRPAFKKIQHNDSDGEMPPSNQLALESKRSRKTSEYDGHGSAPLEELSPNRAKRLKTSKAETKKAKAAPFPMNADLDVKPKKPSSKSTSRKPAPFPMNVDVKAKEPSPQSSRKPAPFPVGVTSPQTSFHSRKAAPFPLESPSSQRQPPCSKSLARRPSPSPDDDDDLKMTEDDIILTRGGPRPFPMSMSQFPPGPASISKQSTHGREGRTDSGSRSPPEPGDFRELSLDGIENVDPSTICPYCDEPWPSAPSPTLIALLERTKRKSYVDPRHGNALGLKAPLAAFVELCQRHRFEMTHLPLALARGWPTRIDFASLPRRIRAFKKELGRLLDRPNESKFWREVRDDAKEVGMTKVVSLTGQYATFERTQPGYYGEQGSIIIHQTLYSLFPPDNISMTSTLPLTPDQFLTRVLVPETALLLIQQDMGLSTKDAMDVLDESKQYGVAMFPEQAQGAEVEEVGEQLARSRAKARKKVLEERGEADADVRREVERERRRARKAKTGEKGEGKDKDNESDTDCAEKTWLESTDDSAAVVTDPAHQRRDMDADVRREVERDRRRVRKAKTGEIKKGKNKVIESDTDCEEKERLEATDHSAAVVTKPGHQRRDTNRDSRKEGVSEEPTPRPARVVKGIQESSRTSWRSTRSPSTSPVSIPMEWCSSSLHKSNRTSPSSSQSTECTGNVVHSSRWSFKLQDEYSSSGPEDATHEETIVCSNHKVIAGRDDSDSDVLVIAGSETPKPRPKTHRAIKKPATKTVSTEESGSEAMLHTDLGKSKRQPRYAKQEREVGVEENVKMKDHEALGRTKRRKKGNFVNTAASPLDSGKASGHSWLLSDSDV